MHGAGRVKRSESIKFGRCNFIKNLRLIQSNSISELLENLGYFGRIYFSKASPAHKDGYARP